MKTFAALRLRRLSCSVLMALIAFAGCEAPVPFELSPLDPGTDSFEFPAEHLTVSGSDPSRLTISWTSRTSSATETVVERASDEGPFEFRARLSGTTRAWQDLSIALGHTYTYRVTLNGPSGSSAPVAVKSWWEMQILRESDQVSLETSSPIVGLAISEQTDASRVVCAQADGRLTLLTYNGVRFVQTATTLLAKPSTGVAVSPYGDYVAATFDSTLMIYGPGLQFLESAKLAKPVRSPSFSLSGFRLMTGGDDGIVRIWQTVDGNLIDSIVLPDGPIAECLYDRSGEVIGVLSQNGVARFFRVSDGSLISSVTVPGGQRLSMDDTGELAVITRPVEGQARVVRVVDGATVKDIDGPSNLRRALFLPTTRSVLMVGGLPGPKLHDVTRGIDLPLPTGFSGDLPSVVVGEFGRRVAYLDGASRVSLWYAQPRWISVAL